MRAVVRPPAREQYWRKPIRRAGNEQWSNSLKSSGAETEGASTPAAKELMNRPPDRDKESVNNDDRGPLLTNCLALEMRAISELRRHPRHARRHNPAKTRRLSTSIGALGFNVPVLVDASGQVLAGYACLSAAKILGMTHVPTISLHHLSETQATAFMLAHNKLAEDASWDDHKLAIQLKELSDLVLSFEIEATGFELPEIDFRIQSLEALETVDQLDDFAFPARSAVTALGDLWHLGDHSLLCANALEQASYAGLLRDTKAAMVFTDPPYNVKINGNAAGYGKTTYREFPMAIGEMSDDEFIGFLTTTLSNARSNTAPGGLMYVCMDWRHSTEMHAAARASHLDQVNLCVWVKQNGRLGSFYKSRHELIFIFKNGKEAHQNNIQLGRFGRNRTNVWFYPAPGAFGRKDTPGDVELHPTMKPLLLVADAILDCTRRGDLILDPFLGSGTTLLAAERTGRRCAGIELDPLYVDAAVERWQRMTGRKAHNQLGETFDFLKSRRGAVDD